MKHLLLVVTAALALTNLAAAASYKVTIMEKVTVDGKDLAPGDYQVEVKDKTAVIRKGKDTTEVKVRTEANERKYDSTSVRFNRDGDKNNLEEIHIGGTKTKLVFEESKTANGGN